MNDKLNITIRIAGQPPIALQINRDEEPRIRQAEYQVNRLWGRWSERFKEKTPMEVLAMVAYKFAELFYAQSETATEVENLLSGFETDLDRILLDVEQK